MIYTNIYLWLKNEVSKASSSIFKVLNEELDLISIEIPKNKSHGDLSTNAAMLIGRSLKLDPREVATKLIEKLKKINYIKSIDLAGPAFINFTFTNEFWHNVLNNILIKGETYGACNISNSEKVNIEFVSANPTGPMHIGHARGAIYGDVLARIMKFAGFNITKEYYVNDAGGQIQILTKSAHLRYLESLGEKITIPEGYYPGEYLKVVGKSIREKYGEKFRLLEGAIYNEFSRIVIDEMLGLIKADLAELKIHHDIFFSEASLYKQDVKGERYIDTSMKILESRGFIYNGKLPNPKGEEDPEWDEREDQLLFKATNFGDDQDRSLTKSDGGWTYFAGDIAYAKNKIDRGFTHNIIILGADHAGYVKRLKAVYKAISSDVARADIILSQMVNFIEDGKPIKMSKRAGNFTTVADVIREVGSDILRFIMLTRKNDIILDFDLDLVKTQSKENPVFYVQYSQVRAASVINNAKENCPEAYEIFFNNKYDLSKLVADVEIELIKKLAFWTKTVISSVETMEVHKIAYYLQDLAASFHSLWNLGKEYPDYRFVMQENPELSASRLALVSAIASVIRIGLKLIGVKPVDKM